MKRISIASFVVGLGLALLAAVVCAEMAKEGNGNYRTGKSGTMEIMMMGQDMLQMNFDESGAFVEAPENSPFINASYRSIGTLNAINKNFKGSGAVLITCANGDQIFGSYQMTGVLGVGPTSGLIEFIGGTGECTGIQGRMEMLPRPAVKPSKKGTYQGIGLGSVTWKIP